MSKDLSLERESVSNERGIIADNYRELQAVHILEKAKKACPLPKASDESTIQILFQSVEVALINLTDLLTRAKEDIGKDAFGKASIKMAWARGFHRVLVSLSSLPAQLCVPLSKIPEKVGYLSITDSPSYGKYFDTLKAYDKELLKAVHDNKISIETTLAEQSLDSTNYMLIHLTRVCNLESTIWERNLAQIAVPLLVQNYEAFVVPQVIHNAVYDRTLTGDTYLTQFRGLHQIPEILSAEINDRIEAAILAIRSDKLRNAYEHLRVVNILAAGILVTLPVIVDNLSTSDYHVIRENLGLTSGSHSVNLHYHLFKDLYSQLGEELTKHMLINPEIDDVTDKVRQTEMRILEDEISFYLHLLVNECLVLRSFIHTWRDFHLQLPRNNLGGNYTKSLTGSLDAVTAVKKMKQAAREKDSMSHFSTARLYESHNSDNLELKLLSYFESEFSSDKFILEATGEVTKNNFKDVQERLGIFANKSSFTSPPKRKV